MSRVVLGFLDTPLVTGQIFLPPLEVNGDVIPLTDADGALIGTVADIEVIDKTIVASIEVFKSAHNPFPDYAPIMQVRADGEKRDDNKFSGTLMAVTIGDNPAWYGVGEEYEETDDPTPST